MMPSQELTYLMLALLGEPVDELVKAFCVLLLKLWRVFPMFAECGVFDLPSVSPDDGPKRLDA
jgi:hypothetical protein